MNAHTDTDNALLERLGIALYGEKWVRPMSRDIDGISLSLLSAMTSGRSPVPVTDKTRARLVDFIQKKRDMETRRYSDLIKLLAQAEARFTK